MFAFFEINAFERTAGFGQVRSKFEHSNHEVDKTTLQLSHFSQLTCQFDGIISTLKHISTYCLCFNVFRFSNRYVPIEQKWLNEQKKLPNFDVEQRTRAWKQLETQSQGRNVQKCCQQPQKTPPQMHAFVVMSLVHTKVIYFRLNLLLFYVFILTCHRRNKCWSCHGRSN